jgi:uncharacterized protein YjiK
MLSLPRFILAAALCAQFLLVLGACRKVSAENSATQTHGAALLESSADEAGTSAELSGWVFETAFPVPEIPEPSGLCFHPMRNTIFVVDDGGAGREPGLYEIDLEANLLDKAQFGRDLEGVCYCPRDGLLYVSDEADESVYVFDPEIKKIYGQVSISRSFDGAEYLKAGGNGFEGIEFIPDIAGGKGRFVLLNQDDPHALVFVSYSEMSAALDESRAAQPDECFALPEVNAGELHYNGGNGELWVINSWMNVMQVYRAETMELQRWEVVPGAAQEGITLDAEGRLWIGQDLGGMARYLWKGEN